MKKMNLLKILTGGFAAATCITPIAAITSCSNINVSQLVKEAINKLVEMNKHARCTTDGDHREYLDAMRSYIAKEAIIAGINFEDICTDTYGNLWFDVPATKGCENWEPLILQGHMDMVVAGLEESKKATTPIDVEVDWKHNIVHSKDYKTTLGADNGIGVAIALTLIQDTTLIHGPIRCLFTANEDSGMLGAKALFEERSAKPVLSKMGKTFGGSDIKYLLNIDNEENGSICRSCAGSATYKYEKKDIAPSSASALSNKYKLDINDLAGGHSGEDITKNRANAFKCLFEVLEGIQNQTKSVQLVKCTNIQDGKEISFGRNQIVPYATILFNSDADTTLINSIIDNCKTQWKAKYTGEDWTKVNVTISTSTEDHTKFIDADFSSKFIKKLGTNVEPEAGKAIDDRSIWFGYKADAATEYSYCANISPLTIKLDSNGKFQVNMLTQTRMKDSDKSTPNYNLITEYYRDIEIDSTKIEATDSVYKPWVYDSNNKMLPIVKAGYDLYNVTTRWEDSNGGVEPTWWIQCNENLNLASIGPTIDDAHSVKETLHIDTVQPIIDVTKYVISKMAK